jgi:membrane protein YdbS with pleckstrin-like domain
MDKQTILWIVTAALRLLAGAVAGKLGWDAATQEVNVQTAAGAVVALVLVGISIYTSIKARQKLLVTEPPKK